MKLRALPLLAIPFMPMQCGGDSPPSVSQPIERYDLFPQGISFNVWGASGWVQGELGCADRVSPHSGSTIAWKGNAIEFLGGGTSYSPGMHVVVRCPSGHPYMIAGTGIAYAWG
jgi:hypothetical protein